MRAQSLKDFPWFLWEMVDSFLLWLKEKGYYSYDQYDFWSTAFGRFAKKTYNKNQILGVPLVFPIFLSELFFPSFREIITHKRRFPISDAHFILGYINLFKLKKEDYFLTEAIKVSDDLLKTSIPGYSGYCWGYPFDWQTKGGLAKKGTPMITVVPYCFEAFLSLYDITKEQKYLDIAHSISQFVSKDINDTRISDVSSAGSYTPMDNSMVVNANAYRAYVLIEAYSRFGINEFKVKAEKNINFILENQNSDGSWFYAINNPNDSFIDNFHTCFVLKNLNKANFHLKSSKVHDSIIKGYNFYRNNLFTDNNIPKPFYNIKRIQLVQTELYDYAEGMYLGVQLKDKIPSAFDLAKKLAIEVCTSFQLPDGHFVTRIYKGGMRNTVPYIRWPQAQMFNALTLLLSETGTN